MLFFATGAGERQRRWIAAYDQTVTTSGGGAPYSFPLSAGALPTGLSLVANGALSGTPAVAGSFNFAVRATDANGCQGARAYTVTINGDMANDGLQFYPTRQAAPLAANMIYQPNQILSKAFVVGLSGTGPFNLFAERTLEAIVDVSGFFAP